jgi:hypothetical protein
MGWPRVKDDKPGEDQPGEDQEETRKTFQFHMDKEKLQEQEEERRDGHYLLRSNLTAGDPSVLCALYVQLTQIDAQE